MHFLALIPPAAYFAIGVGIALLILLVLELYNSARVSKLAYPVYEYALKRAEEEASRIVEDARREARALIEKAEAGGLALTQSHTQEDAAAQAAYEQALHAMLERLEAQLTRSAKAAEDAGERMAAAFVEQVQAVGEASRKKLEGVYAALGQENAKRIGEQVQDAFAAAQKEVQQYERARKDVIDSQALALIGEALKITLKKALPPQAHGELVQAALEEAKANQVF